MKLSPKLVAKASLPIAAIGLIGFAIATIDHPEAQTGEPPAPPTSPSPDMPSAVAALGLVEPSSEVIAVASELPGVVREVRVVAGAKVKKGDALFRLDARALEAQAQAARAALRVAEVEARDAATRAARFNQLSDARAVSDDERERVTFAAERAAANADLARAELRRLETDLARLTVRAPIDGEVLRVNVRPGEFAAAGPAEAPLIALGATEILHVRVQIDEEDIVRVAAGARAEGAPRGDATARIPLTFVRFEPQATPKRNLSGGAERVDTRVVEAIYALSPGDAPIFVGQQMDVFIAARPVGETIRGRSG